MENISAEKSLQIITDSLQRSRQAIARNSGRTITLWGVLVTVFSVLIWFLWKQTGSPMWNMLWFAMSAIGMVATILISKKSEKVPKNEVSSTLGSIWMWFGIITTGFYALIWIVSLVMYALAGEVHIQVDLTLIIVLLMGLCGTISGSVMRQCSVRICSLVATFACAAVALAVKGPGQILSFAILGIVALVIPGLILRKKYAA